MTEDERTEHIFSRWGGVLHRLGQGVDDARTRDGIIADLHAEGVERVIDSTGFPVVDDGDEDTRPG